MTLKDSSTSSARIPALDGWRGIAILLVLLDHIQIALTGRYWWPWTETGQHGVTVFFVLSGFLITSKLLEDQTKLKNFYVRRFFRLMPAAWTYLAAISLFTVVTGIQFTSLSEVFSCLFFYRNFAGFNHVSVAGHFWSLSLEEQFYLLWPCILMLFGSRLSRWLAGGGALLCAIYRYQSWSRYDHLGPNFQTQVRADALLVGCLTALFLAETHLTPKIRTISKVLTIPALAALAYSVARFHQLPPLTESIAIAVLITATVLHPVSAFSRSLSFRPLAFLGVVSYSIYLWQDFFIHLWPNDPALQWTSIFIAMPLFALASYYWIERPCVRIGHRLTSKTPRTSSSAISTGLSAPAAPSSAFPPEIP